ncbi:MAG TPA: hypothetical protein VD789_03485 [Thermomicrobiales bacterium]|nr:hypothetical protein [Thermomicrobiales bacterium]
MTHPLRLTALLGGTLAALVLATPATFATQDEQDDQCASSTPEPDTACAIPTDPEVAALIVWVMAVDDGVVIYLTSEGIAHGRSCAGAAELVTMASDLYAGLPEDERLESDLLWANPALTREVYAHSWATTLGIDRGNPINVVFSDFTGDPDSFQSRVYRGSMLAIMCPG